MPDDGMIHARIICCCALVHQASEVSIDLDFACVSSDVSCDSCRLEQLTPRARGVQLGIHQKATALLAAFRAGAVCTTSEGLFRFCRASMPSLDAVAAQVLHRAFGEQGLLCSEMVRLVLDEIRDANI